MRPFASSGRAAIAVLLALVCAGLPALAQGRGGVGPGGGPGGPGSFGGPPPMPGGLGGLMGNNRMPPPSGGEGDSHGGLNLAPPGRWWDDSRFAKALKIDSNQQRRMDVVFNANKATLVTLFKNVQREEKQLSKVTRVRNPDETAIDQQIDRVTQARGELEKAEAHMLLDIRKEMTAEQVAKLEDYLPPQPE